MGIIEGIFDDDGLDDDVTSLLPNIMDTSTPSTLEN